MKPLSLFDNAVLFMERRTQPMHVGALCLLRPPPDAPPDFVARLAERMRQSASAVPPFNHRLVSRFGLRFWEESPDFDPAQHFVHLALPRPGRIRELLAMVSRVHAAHLDRAYPLWRAYLIEGLEDGRIALYAKIHHAMADGVTAIRLLTLSMTADADASSGLPAPWAVSPAQKRRRSLPVPAPTLRGIAAVRALARDGIGGVRPVLERVAQTLRDQRQGHPDCIGSLQAPASLFNQPISGSRRFAAQSYSAARVRAIARRYGASSNDVVLALCGAALRRYLLELGKLPERPLIAAVPVSTSREERDSGNELAFALSHLGTHIADPRERLRAIKACMDYNKSVLRALTPAQLLAYEGLMFAPGVLNLLTGVSRRRGLVNVTISHVPGPRQRLYWQGCELQGLYPVGLIMDGVALNITVVARHDAVDFGLLGCRRTLPRLQRLLQFLEDGITELEAAGQT